MAKRFFDIIFASSLLFIMALPLACIAIVVRATSPGPAIYWSDRVGRNNKVFRMPKFRTMRVDTPAVATHLLNDPGMYLTSIGKILRKTSLDELPQIWSILSNDMSVVGPRPALFNQDDLIALRSKEGIDKLRPGLTGLAQINGRDELSTPEKVRLDAEYLRYRSFWFDLKIIFLTFARVVRRKGVAH